MTIKFAIITCSDTRTLETDEAGQKLEELIAAEGWECVRRVVETDERPFIAGALIDACDHTDADVVLTCGGSGLSLRDVTPEATRDVADREVPGIAEAMRVHSLAITPFAMLSRAICAQRGRTLIINLPGSTKAATENWEGIVAALPHAVKMMAGGGHDTQKSLSEKLSAAAARGELG
ncbi:MogA/MoaB family molybdenum cofactor biosynthesis protein [Adlercreutzia mucosicola]|uniref:MogA/MoaB family molybdenum cofactor biosynthesis protein n=1 Tax=Adlercreutzia mucosicola TaxID=580026 RepID=UPI000419A1AD|nr:MogA/MoaB family molybdenum cofactor biosynthesis protein [Adlercreutzia mucosicola]MCR2034945.1 MogA/MoaB family molybdenum cofactor biosynthesis protein [Adlercreutzia mucosicola]MEB1813785.1 MogA/MoaB family molybdenum cofactor biosynthesis protein [Adlercreutzia mucosicola]